MVFRIESEVSVKKYLVQGISIALKKDENMNSMILTCSSYHDEYYDRLQE